MSMPASTANWHWKNKNVTTWAKSWFERELSTITITEGNEKVSISEVTEVDGDAEVGQRKSKLLTIYDCKIALKWSGVASDGTETDGALSIPEVSHEITLDGLSDYVYDWSINTKSSAAVNSLFALAKSRIPTALETKFAEFAAAMIEIHGKDLTVSNAASAEPSRHGTPAPTSAPATASSSAAKPSTLKAVKKEEKAVNTATITVDANFMAAADDLFEILTDEKRIPTWSRAPAQSKVEVGGQYSLFGGGVKGSYVTLEPPKRIVQTWALAHPDWPDNHKAKLTVTFDQSTDSTKMTLSLAGVPVGLQDETKQNIEGYYIQGLKSIGYVRLIPSSTSSPAADRSASRQKKLDASASVRRAAIFIAVLALVAAFVVPLFSRKSS